MTNQIYVAELDRFGYNLTVAGYSRNECLKAIRQEYYKAYRNRNKGNCECNLREDWKNAREDIIYRNFTPGIVEWI